MNNYLLKLENSKLVASLVFAIQVLIGAVGYAILAEKASSPEGQNYIFWKSSWFWIGVASYVFMFVVVLLKLYVVLRYKTSMRHDINSETGVLIEQTANLPNVRLRKKTLVAILRAFGECSKANPRHKKGLYALGLGIGKDFYNDYQSWKISKNKNFNDEPTTQKLNDLLDYDSEAGMGKFVFPISQGGEIIGKTITVNNCIATENQCEFCEFMEGYLTACLRRITTNERYNVAKSGCQGQSVCNYKIELG